MSSGSEAGPVEEADDQDDESAGWREMATWCHVEEGL